MLSSVTIGHKIENAYANLFNKLKLSFNLLFHVKN